MRRGQPQKTSLGNPQMSPSRAQSPKSPASVRSRSSSPLNRGGIHQPTGRRYQGEVDQESDTDGSPGIRYITEPLIKKLAKQENLARVTALNLSLGKDGGKKFKRFLKDQRHWIGKAVAERRLRARGGAASLHATQGSQLKESGPQN